MIEVGKVYKLKQIKNFTNNTTDEFLVNKIKGSLAYCTNKKTGELYVFNTKFFIDPEKPDEIYSDLELIQEKFKNLIRPMNLHIWDELQEEASFGSLGAAPTPALTGGLTVASTSGCTVNGIPVAGQSVVYDKNGKKKKQKSKKNEELEEFRVDGVDFRIHEYEDGTTKISSVHRYDDADYHWAISKDEKNFTIYIHSTGEKVTQITGTKEEVAKKLLALDKDISSIMVHEDITSEIQQDLSDIIWKDETTPTEIKSILSKAQAEENEAIQSYLDKALKCEELGVPALAKLFRELADDETVHIGCIQGALDKYGLTDIDKILDGQEEAEEILSESTMTELSKEQILAGEADDEVRNKLDIAIKKLEKNKDLRKNEALDEIVKVTPEEMLDAVDATFNSYETLQTVVQNPRELLRVSVYYTNPKDRKLTHTIKLECLNEITGDVLDVVIEEDLTIEDCISLLSDLFRRYKYVEAENFDESHPRYIKDYDHKTQEFKVGDRVNTEDGDGTVERVSILNDGDYWYEVRLDNEDRFIPCYGWELRKSEEDFNESHSRYKNDYDHKTQQFEIGDKVNIEDGDGTIARIDTMNDGDYWYEVELEDGRYVPCYGWEIEKLDEDFHEEYEQITEQIAKYLDRLNFQYANTTDIVYKKEGDYKYLFKFDNVEGIIKVKILQNDDILVDKEYKIDETQDIQPIFDEIESLYRKYGL